MTPGTAIPTRHTLILDTGPLWELIAYSAVDRLGFDSLQPQLQHLRSGSSYKKLTDFIAVFRRRTTTPHVIAEVSSRIVRTQPKGRAAIWSLVYTEFSSMGMEEGVRRLLQMPFELVAKLAATDAGIVSFGQTLDAPAKPLVLSMDFPLISECKRVGLDAKHLRDVLSEAAP